VSLTADVSGILPGANGGTGVANTGLTLTLAGSLSLPAVVQGDIWYGSAAGTISALAKSAGTSNFLKNSGTSNNPAWARPACADLSDAGTTCTVNTGTSGATVPLQNSTFTFSSSLNNVLRYNLTNSSNGASALNVLDFGTDASSTQTEFVQAGSGNATFGAGGSFSIIHNAIFTFRPSNVEQVRINLSGGVCIGCTSDPGAGALLTNASVKSNGATAGIGYATGAGGAVTQGTSRTTGVTLNTVSGDITLVSAAGSASFQSFTVTNSAVAVTDTINVVQKSGTDKYQIFVTAVAAGSFVVTFATTGGTTTEQPVFHFNVIKGVNSFLLERDLAPAGNDNSPAFLGGIAA
jgi:hypothetical protein